MTVFSWLDNCKFTPTLGGTTDWTYSAAVTGYQGPAAAQAQNGANYSYFAISSDLSQWEMGRSLNYNSGTTTFPRSTVLYNSAGTGLSQGGAGTKINFSAPPSVAIVALAEDMANLAGTATVAYRFNLTAGQTTMSGADLNSLTLTYTPGSVLVFENGALLTNGVDYTASNGSSVVLSSGVSGNSEMIVLALSTSPTTSFNTASQYQFTATGGQTVFTGADVNGATLSTNGFFTMVHRNGRLLSPTADYTMTASTVTLTNGANVGDTIEIVTINTNNVTGVTQAALDNSTNMATTAYVDRLFNGTIGANGTQQAQAQANIGIASAWTAYTPTLTVTSGALTTSSAAGRFKQVGKTVYFTAKATLTNVGTATGRLSISLPTTVGAMDANFAGIEQNQTGDSFAGLAVAGGTTILCVPYNNSGTNLLINGAVFTVSGVYESA